jgi:hypothetical protein
MKLFRKLRVIVLLVAVLALVTGFIVLNAPQKADASRPSCDCVIWVCTVEPPIHCWSECRPCPPPPSPPTPIVRSFPFTGI